MIQITCGIYCWHPCMFACCVCGNHALCKPGTNAGAACLCLPVDVLDRSCVMVAYPVIHHWVSEDSLLYSQYYISTNFSNYKDTVLNLTPLALSRCCMLCCKLAYVNPETVKISSAGTCKSTGIQFILVLPRTEKSWKIRLTEYSIQDSPCMHAMQRGSRFACMRVWAGQLSRRSCWQPNMPEWRHDAGPPGPSAGRKLTSVSNGRYVCFAKPFIHR